jgi:hypothetical protein
MDRCMHRWQLRNVKSPFAGLVVCEGCHAVIHSSLQRDVGQSTIRLEVLNYGHFGLSLEDLESALGWLSRSLQLGRQHRSAMLARDKAVRHQKKKRAA